MNSHITNLLHAVLLIALSIWDYYTSINPSIVQLIPIFFGVVLLSLNNGVQYKLKAQSKAALGITFLSCLCIAIILWFSFTKADNLDLIRYAVLLTSGFFSLIYLVKSL